MARRKTIPQLQPYLKERDRQVRERAFRLGAEAYLEKRDEMAALFDKMFAARQRVARNAGLRELPGRTRSQSKHRFDYTPADCARFHDAVERRSCPAVERQLEYRRERLGLDTRAAVGPRRRAGARRPAQAVRGCRRRSSIGAKPIFHRVDPSSAPSSTLMADEGLLDLESRQGQSAGRLLHEAQLSRQAVHLHERRRRARRREHARARGRACVPRLRGASAAAHLAAIARARSRRAGVDEHGAARGAASRRSPTGYYSADEARSARIEHLEDMLFSLAAHRERRRVPELDLHERRRGMTRRRATRVARDPRALRARRRLVGLGARARGPLVPAAAHLRVPVLLHRVRDRAAGRAPGLATQPQRIRRRPCASTATLSR